MSDVICFLKRYKFRSLNNTKSNVYAAHPHTKHTRYTTHDTRYTASEWASERTQRINVSGRICQSDSQTNEILLNTPQNRSDDVLYVCVPLYWNYFMHFFHIMSVSELSELSDWVRDVCTCTLYIYADSIELNCKAFARRLLLSLSRSLFLSLSW